MIEKSNINEVKKNIEGYVGQKVLLRGTLGRNKSFEKEGTLVNTSSCIFMVKTDDGQKSTYSYIDVLTKSVELGISSNGNYNSILDSMTPTSNVTL